jgi:hypothetical protein
MKQNKTSIWVLGIIFFCGLWLSCDDGQKSPPTAPASDASAGFTFFNLGKNTRLSGRVREDLSEKLGRDAIAERNIIDLEINYRGFLSTYFPALNRLNQRLNFPPGERVDHNTVKLMYRYAQKENFPFDYVELVFSNYTKTPLLFRIHFRRDEAGIVNTLKNKYGPPRMIDWQEQNGQSMVWERDGDFLIVSLVPDQFGNPEYQISIYFVDNLTQLVETEKKEEEKREAQRARSGKKAF